MGQVSQPATDRFKYAYDEVGNRLYRENLIDAAFSELYDYDDLNQLIAFARGTLNSTKDDIPSPTREQGWDFDAVGNWDTLTTNGVERTTDWPAPTLNLGQIN